LTGAAALAGLATLVHSGTRECGFIDTVIGLSGCTASRTIAGVSTLGSTLARDDDGHEGLPRAILQVWNVETGAVLVRYDIDTDLSPALAWHDDGEAVFVATAAGGMLGAATQLRRYGVEVRP